MQKITEVGVFSLAKIMAISAFLLSLIGCIPWGLIIMIAGIIGGGQAESVGLLIGMGLFTMIGVPLLYGVMTFIVGLIYGLVLNLVLRLAGGLEVRIASGRDSREYS